MENEFRTSDMELMAQANRLIRYDEYLRMRSKYYISNKKFSVSAEIHRRIMDSAVRIAKMIIAKGGTDEEIKDACAYLYICTDARKYKLNWQKAKKDFGIDEMLRKYEISLA